ncbi:M56 family metallopeptidase [Pedobacter heparinus]|uniref:Peptidase M56 BlaR1 n=1 Tax=Pedobacter heparinus (strain ATCC 13125 / DSM 2366 / CIP 104194 / JCM 7457 / NBRC 12017 / NCIMB 9290 / NRRL B-14731 / HIM 762-3) TaxID=485917 RepID=C6Y3S9_PEDHD|nr:M56 family metallopeptidase [Pedobacter heparinus]ACU03358.1 peptidase M56 BlaR1 [Pedobacter heparinus DSM 2366]
METIVNNLIKATGWSIFHSLWQAAIIYGVLLLLIAFFPKMTAKLKHNLAYGAISLMFAGFCITFFSIFKLPANDMLISAGNKEIVLMQYASDLSDGINQKTEQFFPYIVNVYAIGLLCQLLILAAGYRKLHKLKEADKTSVPEAWLKVFKEMLSRLGLRQPISFYLSDQVNIPLVIGYFKPMVLFPIALVAQLDIKQVEAILIHELSHIRRNDYLLNLIKTAIETLMFFNPFIWLSSRFINIEREHACDDLVLKLTGTPLTYAHALLKLEILKDKTTPALSMAANGSNQHLYQRIKRITDMKTNYMNAKQQIFAITLTIATVISLAWISPEKTEPAFLKPQVPVLPVPPVPAPLSEAKIRHFSNPLVKLNVLPLLRQDTTRKKHKFKIVTIDASGRKQEYNSVKEMPDSLRKEVIKDTFVSKGDFDFNIDSVVNKSLTFTMSPEWQSGFKKMSEDLQKQFSAEEWTKNSEDIKKNSEKMKKFFDSKEWKKQQQDIKKNSERIQLFFNSAEWKNQQKQLIEHSREIAIKLNSPEFKKELDKAKLSEKMRLHFSAPIFKQKSEETKTLEASKAYQDLKKKFDEDVETLKKKTIKADTTSF